MAQKRLISIDWGTTSLRAYLVDATGEVIERFTSERGIRNVPDGRYAEALREVIVPWLAREGPLPLLASGMIGSRNGWVEAPYVPAPADARSLAIQLAVARGEGVPPLPIVPGVRCADTEGIPDLMRGEETQVIGAAKALGLRQALFVLPGTHSKWVVWTDGHIAGFRTFMTGEVFAVLRAHSILGALAVEAPGDPAAFARGNATARGMVGQGGLLHRLFSVRSLVLAGELRPEAVASYLSGLLVGAEIAEALRWRDLGECGGWPISIVGRGDLVTLYRQALVEQGVASTEAPADAVVAGHLEIARLAGLIQTAR